jgi:hypothetical protein
MPIRIRHFLLLFWIAPAVVAALGMQLVWVRYNPDLTFIEKLGSQLLIWLSWGVWSLLILAVCDRVPLTGGPLWRALLVHVPLAALIVIAQILVVAWASWLYGLSPSYGFTSTLAVGIRSFGDIFLVVYCAILGAHTAFRWHEAWRAQTIVSARLGEDLAQAKLSALRAQMNPHFLFNALASAVVLVGRDPPKAQRMIVQIGDLLRSTLALPADQEVPLQQELEIVGRYLDIELIRFSDRLRVEWQVEDAARMAAVPALVLQPLVENALVHGIARVRDAGQVTIGARAHGATLTLTVRDSGPGPTVPPKNPGTGIGIRNLRERLDRLYASAATLAIADAPGGGCIATVVLPWRVVATAAADQRLKSTAVVLPPHTSTATRSSAPGR